MMKNIDHRSQSDEWSDEALATLFQASLSLGTNETQLIWTRFTGFLILNGFLVGAAVNVACVFWQKSDAQIPYISMAYLALGAFGIVINSVWHVMNFSGWLNQNKYLRSAIAISKRLRKYSFSIDVFRNNNRMPHGFIYWMAQSIPSLFFIVSYAVFSISIGKINNANWEEASNIVIVGGSFFLITAIVILCEHYVVASITDKRLALA